MSHYKLATTVQAPGRREQVPPVRKLGPDLRRYGPFEPELAVFKVKEPWSFEGFLGRHSEVKDVAYQLDVALGLHVSADQSVAEI
jgi:hypothetical protein